MKKKMIYEAPAAEQMEVRLEAGLLTLSGGAATAPNVENMSSGDIYEGAEW